MEQSKIASMTHMLVRNPADVAVNAGADDKGRYTIWFRALADDPMSAIAFSGSPAVLKATFAQALDLLDVELRTTDT